MGGYYNFIIGSFSTFLFIFVYQIYLLCFPPIVNRKTFLGFSFAQTEQYKERFYKEIMQNLR